MKFSSECKYSDIDKQILVEEYITFRAMVNSLNKNTPYYVYVLFEPNGTPRYVGKGKGMRGLSHIMNYVNNNTGNMNSHLKSVMDSNDEPLITKLYKENLSEAEALDLEKKLIAMYGRFFEGGTLSNILSNGYLSADAPLASLGGKIGGTVTKTEGVGIFNERWNRSEETKRRWDLGIISNESFKHLTENNPDHFRDLGLLSVKSEKGIHSPGYDYSEASRKNWATMSDEKRAARVDKNKTNAKKGSDRSKELGTNFSSLPKDKLLELTRKAGAAMQEKYKNHKRYNNGIKNIYATEHPGDGWVEGWKRYKNMKG